MTHLAFIDESGVPGIANIDPSYPNFALTAALYRRGDYIAHEVPLLAATKLQFWNHEGVVFHAYEIKKKAGDFALLADVPTRARFLTALNAMFGASRAKLICAIIDKRRHAAQYVAPEDPYFLTVQFVLERIHMAAGNDVDIVFESRGRTEDARVLRWCEAICGGRNHRSERFGFRIGFARKRDNVAGLQIADLACQPLMVFAADRGTTRPDCIAVKSRLRCDWQGRPDGRGLKVFP